MLLNPTLKISIPGVITSRNGSGKVILHLWHNINVNRQAKLNSSLPEKITNSGRAARIPQHFQTMNFSRDKFSKR